MSISLTSVVVVPAGRLCAVTVDGAKRRSNARWNDIAAELLADMQEGRLNVGDRFPSYGDFKARWGLGRKSASKVIAFFAELRAIEVVASSGTTVVAIPVEGAEPPSVSRVTLDRLDVHEGRLARHDDELAELRARLEHLERGGGE